MFKLNRKNKVVEKSRDINVTRHILENACEKTSMRWMGQFSENENAYVIMAAVNGYLNGYDHGFTRNGNAREMVNGLTRNEVKQAILKSCCVYVNTFSNPSMSEMFTGTVGEEISHKEEVTESLVAFADAKTYDEVNGAFANVVLSYSKIIAERTYHKLSNHTNISSKESYAKVESNISRLR